MVFHLRNSPRERLLVRTADRYWAEDYAPGLFHNNNRIFFQEHGNPGAEDSDCHREEDSRRDWRDIWRIQAGSDANPTMDYAGSVGNRRRIGEPQRPNLYLSRSKLLRPNPSFSPRSYGFLFV